MNNVQVRLLLFFIALPLLACMLLFLPFFQYGAFSFLCMAAAGIAALELGNIFKNRGTFLVKPVVFFLGMLGPLSAYGEVLGIWDFSLSSVFYIILLACLFSLEIIKKHETDFSASLPRMAAYTFIALYPGIFSSFVVRLVQFPQAGILILVFLLTTFLNDSFAWTFGMLFGKNNRNILVVSPNKSLVGFIFGFFASILVMVISWMLFPALFPFSLATAVLFGSILGITTLLGDLIESVIKRSGAVKDSGAIIPGRGGLLDSIDSPLFNAPFFFYLYHWFSGIGL